MRTEGFPATRGGRLGAVAPVPYVGAAALLVALIVFTPVLLATGPSAIAVQPELLVYRAAGSPATSYGVHGTGSTVGYRWVNISLGTGFLWDGRCPTPTDRLNWSYSNESNTTTAAVPSGANPVVVNVTVVYLVSSGQTVYAGELAFNLVNQNTSSESLQYVPCPWTPTVSSGGSWPVSIGTALPIDLVNYGSGGPT